HSGDAMTFSNNPCRRDQNVHRVTRRITSTHGTNHSTARHGNNEHTKTTRSYPFMRIHARAARTVPSGDPHTQTQTHLGVAVAAAVALVTIVVVTIVRLRIT